MRTPLTLSVLLIAAFQLLFVNTVKGQSIATEKVELGLKDESLETAIKRIEQQTVLRFFYRDADIKPLAHLNLMQDTRTIGQTLDALLQNTFLSFRQVGNHILLERKDQVAYYEIKGVVIDSADKKPVANASVFINNTTIGTITDNNGGFKLSIARPGKCELIASIIGYANYKKILSVDDDLSLPVIEMAPAVIKLSEVKVKTDPEWDKNYKWFKEEFLGNWNMAAKCTILNPEILDLNYDKKTGVLTAVADEFLEIENQALGYKLKYLLTQFSSDKKTGKVNYKGFALFEPLAGDQDWQAVAKNRMKTYKGTVMHFLRSALENQLDAEGFRVLRLKKIDNPDYKSGTLDIKYIDVLGKTTLRTDDFVQLTTKRDVYALSFKDCLYVMYTRLHNYTGNLATIPLFTQPNYAKTTLTIVAPYTFFDNNGIIINPESLVFEGYWAGSRVAELLPSDYEPGK